MINNKPISDEEIKAAADALGAAFVDAAGSLKEQMQFPPVRAGKAIGLMRAEPGEYVYGCDSAVMKMRGDSVRTVQDVALTPDEVQDLIDAGHTVTVQSGAGRGAEHPDSDYERAGATVVYSDERLLEVSDVVFKAGGFTLEEIRHFRRDQIVFGRIGAADRADVLDALIASGVTAFALEKLPFGHTAPAKCDGFDIAWERSDEARLSLVSVCLRMLDKGVQVACADDVQLRNSLVTYDGVLTDADAAAANHRDFRRPEDALGINMWTLDIGDVE